MARSPPIGGTICAKLISADRLCLDDAMSDLVKQKWHARYYFLQLITRQTSCAKVNLVPELTLLAHGQLPGFDNFRTFCRISDVNIEPEDDPLRRLYKRATANHKENWWSLKERLVGPLVVGYKPSAQLIISMASEKDELLGAIN